MLLPERSRRAPAPCCSSTPAKAGKTPGVCIARACGANSQVKGAAFAQTLRACRRQAAAFTTWQNSRKSTSLPVYVWRRLACLRSNYKAAEAELACRKAAYCLSSSGKLKRQFAGLVDGSGTAAIRVIP